MQQEDATITYSKQQRFTAIVCMFMAIAWELLELTASGLRHPAISRCVAGVAGILAAVLLAVHAKRMRRARLYYWSAIVFCVLAICLAVLGVLNVLAALEVIS
jgi:uncharacterized protein YacL